MHSLLLTMMLTLTAGPSAPDQSITDALANATSENHCFEILAAKKLDSSALTDQCMDQDYND